METPVVEMLPVLNQADFPPLPGLAERDNLVCCGTDWQNAEREFAASVIIVACVRAKMWQPVSAPEFSDWLRAHPLIPPPMWPAVATALWELVQEQFLSVVSFQGVNHFVPTKGFATIALRDVRRVPAR